MSLLKVLGLDRADHRSLTGEKKKQLRDWMGMLPKYTSIGCYPLVYYVVDPWSKHVDSMCPDCASDPSEPVVAYEILYEGEEYCIGCSRQLEVAYPEDEDED